MKVVLATCLVFISSVALADILPLRHGVFVIESKDCQKPPNSFALTYLGDKIIDGYYSCILPDSQNDGNRYMVHMSCVPKYAGALLDLPSASFIVSDLEHFSLDRGSNGANEQYRWCGDNLKSLGD